MNTFFSGLSGLTQAVYSQVSGIASGAGATASLFKSVHGASSVVAEATKGFSKDQMLAIDLIKITAANMMTQTDVLESELFFLIQLIQFVDDSSLTSFVTSFLSRSRCPALSPQLTVEQIASISTSLPDEAQSSHCKLLPDNKDFIKESTFLQIVLLYELQKFAEISINIDDELKTIYLTSTGLELQTTPEAQFIPREKEILAKILKAADTLVTYTVPFGTRLMSAGVRVLSEPSYPVKEALLLTSKLKRLTQREDVKKWCCEFLEFTTTHQDQTPPVISTSVNKTLNLIHNLHGSDAFDSSELKRHVKNILEQSLQRIIFEDPTQAVETLVSNIIKKHFPLLGAVISSESMEKPTDAIDFPFLTNIYNAAHFSPLLSKTARTSFRQAIIEFFIRLECHEDTKAVPEAVKAHITAAKEQLIKNNNDELPLQKDYEILIDFCTGCSTCDISLSSLFIQLPVEYPPSHTEVDMLSSLRNLLSVGDHSEKRVTRSLQVREVFIRDLSKRMANFNQITLQQLIITLPRVFHSLDTEQINQYAEIILAIRDQKIKTQIIFSDGGAAESKSSDEPLSSYHTPFSENFVIDTEDVLKLIDLLQKQQLPPESLYKDEDQQEGIETNIPLLNTTLIRGKESVAQLGAEYLIYYMFEKLFGFDSLIDNALKTQESTHAETPKELNLVFRSLATKGDQIEDHKKFIEKLVGNLREHYPYVITTILTSEWAVGALYTISYELILATLNRIIPHTNSAAAFLTSNRITMLLKSISSFLLAQINAKKTDISTENISALDMFTKLVQQNIENAHSEYSGLASTYRDLTNEFFSYVIDKSVPTLFDVNFGSVRNSFETLKKASTVPVSSFYKRIHLLTASFSSLMAGVIIGIPLRIILYSLISTIKFLSIKIIPFFADFESILKAVVSNAIDRGHLADVYSNLIADIVEELSKTTYEEETVKSESGEESSERDRTDFDSQIDARYTEIVSNATKLLLGTVDTTGFISSSTGENLFDFIRRHMGTLEFPDSLRELLEKGVLLEKVSTKILLSKCQESLLSSSAQPQSRKTPQAKDFRGTFKSRLTLIFKQSITDHIRRTYSVKLKIEEKIHKTLPSLLKRACTINTKIAALNIASPKEISEDLRILREDLIREFEALKNEAARHPHVGLKFRQPLHTVSNFFANWSRNAEKAISIHQSETIKRHSHTHTSSFIEEARHLNQLFIQAHVDLNSNVEMTDHTDKLESIGSRYISFDYRSLGPSRTYFDRLGLINEFLKCKKTVLTSLRTIGQSNSPHIRSVKKSFLQNIYQKLTLLEKSQVTGNPELVGEHIATTHSILVAAGSTCEVKNDFFEKLQRVVSSLEVESLDFTSTHDDTGDGSAQYISPNFNYNAETEACITAVNHELQSIPHSIKLGVEFPGMHQALLTIDQFSEPISDLVSQVVDYMRAPGFVFPLLFGVAMPTVTRDLRK